MFSVLTHMKCCRLPLQRVNFGTRCTNSNICVGVLVANKIDLEERRVISTPAGEEFAQSKGLAYFECSAVSIINSFYCLFYLFLNVINTRGGQKVLSLTHLNER